MLTEREERLMGTAIARLSQEGWEVVTRLGRAVQIRKRKQWHVPGLVLFAFLPLLGGFLWAPLFGVGAFGLVLMVVDYLNSRDKLAYLTIEDIDEKGIAEGGERAFLPEEPRLAVILGIVGLFFAALMLLGQFV